MRPCSSSSILVIKLASPVSRQRSSSIHNNFRLVEAYTDSLVARQLVCQGARKRPLSHVQVLGQGCCNTVRNDRWNIDPSSRWKANFAKEPKKSTRKKLEMSGRVRTAIKSPLRKCRIIHQRKSTGESHSRVCENTVHLSRIVRRASSQIAAAGTSPQLHSSASQQNLRTVEELTI